ncbi:intradiol ring-cleavage dioxygenase [Streptosporangium sp. NPDC049078]|uniref:intradiol ring-cleavage dioxygenase n=1 Tax=Streptosporangium sp. NPDC049078 TaxID=3155767 RepID=UPI00343D1780
MKNIDRRTALAGLGTVGLGTLLAACAGSDSSTTRVATTTGGTATVQPTTASSTGLAALFEDAPTCVLTEETTQGPYHFDAGKIRSDIREDRQGSTLRVAIRVLDAATCEPIPSAVVEIWHCDAGGVYSGFESASQAAGGGPTGERPTGAPPSGGPGGQGEGVQGPGADDGMADATPTDEKRYLRGAQVTNTDGIVEFVTIYPGWYQGRSVHIHAMVHIGDSRVLTTQMFCDETVSDQVYAARPYADHTGQRLRNESDSIYDDSLLMKLTVEGDGHLGVMTFSAPAAK